jgi:hypothetical protein
MKKVKINLRQEVSKSKHSHSDVQIEVFVTKTRKFRAAIKELDKPWYEVTVNSSEWKKGKGARYWVAILEKCHKILATLESELW